ncbi:hypothetical protein KP509_01G044200 [Ceratopteris richardii]|uniref:Uncharacterized protein n=1 Tax=Ceratopteris richardii TaxID=49495 RepID=A0A8T2VG46_CERRI|nr:hypothetical protein KP509_01G044200 [Ceratopteris richardii]
MPTVVTNIAIVRLRSQLKVELGKFYDIRRFTSNLDTFGFNKQISINRILLVHDEAVIKIGSPWLSNAVVKGRLLHSCSKKKKGKYGQTCS